MAIRRGDSLYWKTGIDTTGVKKGANQTKGILKNLSQQITGMDVFAGLGIAATLAFTKIAKESTEMALTLEQSMREVQTISGYAQESFEEMTASVIEMSTTVPEGADNLAKALYQIVSAGYDGAAGMKLLEVSAKAAVAGVTDTATAADGLTTVMNAWKYSAEDATLVADILFTTVKLGKTTFEELANSISQVAALASASNIPLTEITAAIASLTKQGVPTAQAMTQIRASIIGLSKTLGDGWSSTMTYQDAMQAVVDLAGGSQVELQKYLGSIEGVGAALSLTGENSVGAQEDLDAMNNSIGASTDAFDFMAQSAENKLAILKNVVNARMLEIGSEIKDVLADLAVGFVEALDSGKLQKVVDVMSVLVASMVAYSVASSVATITTSTFQHAIFKVKYAMMLLNATMLKNPVVLLTAGIVAAMVAFQKFSNNAKHVERAVFDMDDATQAFQKNVSTLDTELSGLFGILKSTTSGTDEHTSAIEAINKEYGDYLTNLLDEKSTLEDIKIAQDEAREAAISRIAETAKAKALEEENAKVMDRIGKGRQEVYNQFRDDIGDKGALEALKEYQQLIKDFNNPQTARFKDSENEGFKTFLSKAERQSEVLRQYVETYASSLEPETKKSLEASLLYSLLGVQSAQAYYDEAEKQVNAYWDGFIQTTKKNEGGNGGSTSFIIDAKEAKKKISEAEGLFKEWSTFKNTSYADDLQPQYDYLLKDGETYEQWLNQKLKDWKGNAEALALVNKELAQIQSDRDTQLEKDFQAVKEAIRKDVEKMLKSIDSAKEKRLDNEAKAAKAVKDAVDFIIDLEYSQLSAREKLDIKLLELHEAFLKAGYALDEKYDALRKKLIKDYMADVAQAVTQVTTATFSALSDVMSDFDDDAAEGLGLLGETAGAIGGTVVSALSGDIAGAVSGAVGSLAKLYKLMNFIGEADMRQATAEWEAEVVILDRAVAQLNFNLEQHLKIIKEIDGQDWLKGQFDTVDKYNDALLETMGLLQRIEVEQASRSGFVFKPDTSEWDIDQWQQWLIDFGDSSPYKDQVAELISTYTNLDEELSAFVTNMEEEATGIVRGAMTDEIVAMFRAGETSAEDFANKFEDVMTNAIVQTFKRRFLEEQLSGFYDALLEEMTDEPDRSGHTGPVGGTTRSRDGSVVVSRGDGDGVVRYTGEEGINASEMDSLREMWDTIMGEAATGWEAIEEFLGETIDGYDAPDKDALAGAIKGITEDTAGVLAGQITAMRYNMLEQLEVSQESLAVMNQIAYNTANNVYMKKMYDYMRNNSIFRA